MHSYDFFKASLLATPYFEDNIYCHFTASFAAGTVATTVCSPADVLKSRIMNASGPGSSVRFFFSSFLFFLFLSLLIPLLTFLALPTPPPSSFPFPPPSPLPNSQPSSPSAPPSPPKAPSSSSKAGSPRGSGSSPPLFLYSLRWSS
ncbi:uncharacterized protein C8R40DRAFT_1084916 [Lentinula edodes]|uniref:uncharacterized protein n=1 Tax=Lentinula edodes TaxID=5353 RepID=UPI001E8CCB9C|nr:uncharacterized protein C8R40DRAFT_1084916 [Lentinula edodes]KAH7880178.1 hypothetical protein C8R40DRAFT_1084916 [Lentinula edodes]